MAHRCQGHLADHGGVVCAVLKLRERAVGRLGGDGRGRCARSIYGGGDLAIEGGKLVAEYVDVPTKGFQIRDIFGEGGHLIVCSGRLQNLDNLQCQYPEEENDDKP